MPKLSIVIPIYNSELSLDRCILSILNQTFTDWELILVDDGSSDESSEICCGYALADSRIRVICKTNEGAGPTRNAGILISNGVYLAFPDSDDRMSLNGYEECMQILEKYQYDLLVFGMRTEVYDDFSNVVKDIIDDFIPEVSYKKQELFRNKWAWLYQNMDMGSPCNKIYKRSIIMENSILYPAMRRMQDGVFNMYYADKISSFKSINKNFFIRTWHCNEFQRRKMPKNFLDCAIQHHQTLENMLTKWGTYSKKEKLLFSNSFSEIINTAEYEYLPKEKPSLYELYCHIKSINKNEYVNSFLRQLSELRKLSEKEYATLHNWNYVLTVYTYLKMRKASAK